MPSAWLNRHTPWLHAGFVTGALLFASTTHAAEPPRENPPCSANTTADTAKCVPAKPSGLRKGLSAAGAVVPGLLVHGSGHFIAGHTRTGFMLLGAEALGVGLGVGGIAAIAVSGASRRFITPLVLGAVTGGALLFLPVLADLYGVLAPEGGTGSPPQTLPSIETRLGLAYVHDPNFAYNIFVTPGLDVRLRSFRLSASGFFALDDTNSRTRAAAAYRFFGPGPRGTAIPKDGSYLDVEFALTNHDYGREGFSITTGELNLQGRLDLVRVGPTLRGSFAELGLGIGYAVSQYSGIGSEANDLVTPRFAFGMYLGHSGYPRGEMMAYYEHRHDGFGGGFKSRGLGSGIAGHVGIGGRIFASPRWGVAFDAHGGSAYVGQASLLFRYGGNP